MTNDSETTTSRPDSRPGRVAFVTGGAQGIGAAISARLARDCSAVVVGDLNEAGADATSTALREKYGVESFGVGLEVTSSEPVRRAAAETVRAYGRVDVLVNNGPGDRLRARRRQAQADRRAGRGRHPGPHRHRRPRGRSRAHRGYRCRRPAECSGSEAGLAATLASVRSRGTVAQVGLHVRPAVIDAMDLSNRDITLTGTWCYPVQDWPRIIALLATGQLPSEKVVSDVIDAADVVQLGFERLVRPGTDVQKILVRT
ncbi:hypothetical protein BJF90_15775 [Pseudonocardia sp. CNS-004]|nr:hypothetical protein BJF90_15775 [Pseudonocardia sp. CNS-004]